MGTPTFKRIKRLKSVDTDTNTLLKDLHDCIYSWTESIPFDGGHSIDISQPLREIYQSGINLKKRKPQVRKSDEDLSKPIEAINWDEYLLDSNVLEQIEVDDTEEYNEIDDDELDDDELDDF